MILFILRLEVRALQLREVSSNLLEAIWPGLKPKSSTSSSLSTTSFSQGAYVNSTKPGAVVCLSHCSNHAS